MRIQLRLPKWKKNRIARKPYPWVRQLRTQTQGTKKCKSETRNHFSRSPTNLGNLPEGMRQKLGLTYSSRDLKRKNTFFPHRSGRRKKNGVTKKETAVSASRKKRKVFPPLSPARVLLELKERKRRRKTLWTFFGRESGLWVSLLARIVRTLRPFW